MGRRLLIAAVVAFALLAGTAGMLYAFGTPQAPKAPVSPAGQARDVPAVSGPEAPPTGPAGTVTEVPAEIPEPDPSVPLAIEIPGCVCHSDDPKVVEEHAGYRMNQCAGCHAGVTPTGG